MKMSIKRPWVAFILAVTTATVAVAARPGGEDTKEATGARLDRAEAAREAARSKLSPVEQDLLWLLNFEQPDVMYTRDDGWIPVSLETRHFAPGRFGRGYHFEVPQFNYLPPAMADVETDISGFVKQSGAVLERPADGHGLRPAGPVRRLPGRRYRLLHGPRQGRSPPPRRRASAHRQPPGLLLSQGPPRREGSATAAVRPGRVDRSPDEAAGRRSQGGHQRTTGGYVVRWVAAGGLHGHGGCAPARADRHAEHLADERQSSPAAGRRLSVRVLPVLPSSAAAAYHLDARRHERPRHGPESLHARPCCGPSHAARARWPSGT